jgi:tRNA A37 threonylcarbamoyltransferase TsaD
MTIIGSTDDAVGEAFDKVQILAFLTQVAFD